jgi:hypothetical protein
MIQSRDSRDLSNISFIFAGISQELMLAQQSVPAHCIDDLIVVRGTIQRETPCEGWPLNLPKPTLNQA